MTNNLYLTSRKAIRLKQYDYASVGMYFITIVTDNRKPYFGKIENDKMMKSDLGLLLEDYWLTIPNAYKNIKILDYTIMPNHIHGIIQIESYDSNVKLSNVVKYLKARVTSAAKFSVWQRGYYEHVIRSENDLLQIREYINNNVLKWSLDKLNLMH